MSHQSLENAYSQMQNMIHNFPKYYGTYFKTEADDENLLKHTTQPFWQSMRLSKRRLERNQLSMDLWIQPDTKKSKRTPLQDSAGLGITLDGTNLVGSCHQDMKVGRRFYKNDRCIYKATEPELCVTSMLQSNIQDNQVACPNCGRIGSVESYIDGCDACGSKFSVQDFATKVSGFSLEENYGKKLDKSISQSLIILMIATVILIIAGCIGLAMGMFRLMVGLNDVTTVSSIATTIFAIDFVPVGIGGIVTLIFLACLIKPWIRKSYRNRYANEYLIQDSVPAFSAEDFCQNLEYKLRNIHLADHVNEVSTFARCDLEAYVTGYQDVVDCHMSRCKFIQVQKQNQKYLIDVEVTMKLTRYVGGRIKTMHEKLFLSLAGNDKIIAQKPAALREYKCANCGRSINILEGSTCKACDSVFDYGDYGWVITSYSTKNMLPNMFGILRAAIIIGYALAFALAVSAIKADDQSSLSLITEVTDSYQYLNQIYDTATVELEYGLKNADANATLTASEAEGNVRYLTYTTKDAAAGIDACSKHLVANGGYSLYHTSPEGDQWRFAKDFTYQDESGYLILIISTSDSNLVEVILSVSEQLEYE